MKLNQGWRRFLWSMGAVGLVCASVAFFLPAYRNIILLFLYTIPSNSVIPIPHEPAMIFFGRFYPPALVAIVAAFGTMIPCFLDYRAVTFAFQAKKFRQIRESDVYQGAIAYFLKAPFLSILIAAFAPPIPFYILRVLSPTSKYPLKRYMLAVFIGRLPRYYLFALLGSALDLSRLILIGGGILLVTGLLCNQVKKHLAGRRKHPAETADVPLEKVRA